MNAHAFSLAGKGMTKLPNDQISRNGGWVGCRNRAASLADFTLIPFGEFGHFVILSGPLSEARA
jgi:hypothetical protein